MFINILLSIATNHVNFITLNNVHKENLQEFYLYTKFVDIFWLWNLRYDIIKKLLTLG